MKTAVLHSYLVIWKKVTKVLVGRQLNIIFYKTTFICPEKGQYCSYLEEVYRLYYINCIRNGFMGKNCKKVVDLVSIPFAYYTWIQQTHVQINYKENSYKWYIYRTFIAMISYLNPIHIQRLRSDNRR